MSILKKLILLGYNEEYHNNKIPWTCPQQSMPHRICGLFQIGLHDSSSTLWSTSHCHLPIHFFLFREHQMLYIFLLNGFVRVLNYVMSLHPCPVSPTYSKLLEVSSSFTAIKCFSWSFEFICFLSQWCTAPSSVRNIKKLSPESCSLQIPAALFSCQFSPIFPCFLHCFGIALQNWALLKVDRNSSVNVTLLRDLIAIDLLGTSGELNTTDPMHSYSSTFFYTDLNYPISSENCFCLAPAES